MLVLLLGLGTSARAGAPAGETGFLPASPTSWLVLGPVDERGRRPFNPDATFARYLLDPRSPPPRAGETVRGSAGEAAWTPARPDGKGAVGGHVAWAYTRLQAPAAQVAMADLRGGATLFVNGTPFVGSIYGDRFEVPVPLVQGPNDLFVHGVRGAFRLTLHAPPAPVFVAPWRMTRPDAVSGEPLDQPAGLLVVNATRDWLPAVSLACDGNDWLAPSHTPGPLPVAPLGVLQLRLPLTSRPGHAAPAKVGPLSLSVRLQGVRAPAATLPLEVRAPDQPLVRTFVSPMDDSVQAFALRRPAPGGTKRPVGLVLTLHGAGVKARGQVAAYAPKPDFWIVAPTNRGRFGFDWQDWGRQDAYEVLAQALAISGVDRHRVYLTGHSMGGHGTWHLGANDPDGFAAIAPSAGWISFDTYPGPRPGGARRALWQAADGASRTRRLLDNLAQLPIFILHGTADDNVPVEQARQMQKLLTDAGAPPHVHYEQGRGHWWDGHPEPGAQCVDWPGIFDLFRSRVIPSDPPEIHFTTVGPWVDARHHWIEVRAARQPALACRVHARFDAASGHLLVETDNVRALRILHPRRTLTLDDTRLEGAAAQGANWILTGPPDARRWRRAPRERPSPAGAGAARGPLKTAFRHGFVLVAGTHAPAARARGLLAQARFDAQRWMLRAHGQGLVLRDDQVPVLAAALGLRRRHLIAYGNRDVNGLLASAHEPDPVVLAEGRLQVPGGEDVTGPAGAACFVRRGGDAPAAVLGSTGETGSRLGFTLPLFVSGVGWPDYVIFDATVLTRGDGGVRRAGFYSGPGRPSWDDGDPSPRGARARR